MDHKTKRSLIAGALWRFVVTRAKIISGISSFRPLPTGSPISEARLLSVPSGFYDERQLSRVTSCPFGSTVGEEVSKLQARTVEEYPLRLRELGRCTVVGEWIIRDDAVHRLGDAAFSDFFSSFRANTETYLVSSRLGNRYFGHWLQDDCSAQQWAKGVDCSISTRKAQWVDATIYNELFEQGVKSAGILEASNLIAVEDIGFSEGKADRYRSMRKCLRRKINAAKPGRVVFIERGASGARRAISNEATLRRDLENAGVVFVRAETGSIETIQQILDAAVVISVEGSHACHAIYGLRDRGALVILQPPHRFYNPHHEWARIMGVSYGIVVGEQQADGFHIYSREVLNMVDTVMSASSRAVSL